MTKRVLDLLPAELASLTAKELLQAVAGSEGRVLAAETIGITPPLLSDVTNAEFAASMGADLLLLNMFDVWEPRIVGLPETRPEDVVRRVKELTGRMIGINLEPVDPAVCAQNGEWGEHLGHEPRPLRHGGKRPAGHGDGGGPDCTHRKSGQRREQ